MTSQAQTLSLRGNVTMVSVRFFAELREVVGVAELEIDAMDLDAVFTVLAKTYSADVCAQLRADNVRIAVNHELVSGNPTLSGGDEVAFLPPVTGG